MIEPWVGIYGQTPVKQLLDKLIFSGKLPHAIILNGPEGVGKDYLAIRFANLLNNNSSLLNNSNFKKISDYKKLNLLIEPTVKFIFPLPLGKNETSDDGPYEKLSKDDFELVKSELDKKTSNPYYKIRIPRANDIKISSIRDINKSLSFVYDESIYRVVIISSAHSMNEPSQNALLKNLEEPPERVLFILTTSELDSLRETIRSRCWIINLLPLANDDLIKILTTYFGVKEDIARISVLSGDGTLETALDLIQRNLTALRESVITFLRSSMGSRYYSAMKELTPLLKLGEKENFLLFLSLLIRWINDLEKFRTEESGLYFHEFIDTFSKFNARFSTISFLGTIGKIEKFSHQIVHNNLSTSVVAFNLIMEFATIMNPSIKEENL